MALRRGRHRARRVRRRSWPSLRRPSTTPTSSPLRDLGDGLWLLELFHGPTLAFKDVALQLVGPPVRPRAGRAGASGSRSSAPPRATPARRPSRPARDRDGIEIVILHPAGRVSDVQRRQMTTVDSPNVHNLAVEGTFDDCQDLVKAMFADEAFRDRRAPVGGQLHQLGPGDGPGRLLRVRRRPARSAPATPVVLLGAHAATSATSSRLGRPAHGPAHRPARRAPATATTSSPASSPAGVLELRRGASPRSARAWTSRCRPTSSGCSSSCYGRDGAAIAELLPRFRADGRAQLADDPPGRGRRGLRRRRCRRRPAPGPPSPAWHERAGIARRPAHRGRPGGRARPSARDPDLPMVVPGHRPPGQVPRRGRGGHRASGRRCPPAWPTCSAGPSATRSSPTTSTPSARGSAPSPRDPIPPMAPDCSAGTPQSGARTGRMGR